MISLVEHLRERIHVGFTVNHTVSDKIILFDLDDTIIQLYIQLQKFLFLRMEIGTFYIIKNL